MIHLAILRQNFAYLDPSCDLPWQVIFWEALLLMKLSHFIFPLLNGSNCILSWGLLARRLRRRSVRLALASLFGSAPAPVGMHASLCVMSPFPAASLAHCQHVLHLLCPDDHRVPFFMHTLSEFWPDFIETLESHWEILRIFFFFHSPNAHCRTRPKAGAQNLVCVSHGGVRDLSTRAMICCLQAVHPQEAGAGSGVEKL